MEKIIIFGASKLGEIVYNVLKEKYIICFFSDNDSNKWNNEFCGIKVINPKEILRYEDCKIVVASTYYPAISVQLKEYGVNNISIFNCLNIDVQSADKIYSLDRMCNLNYYNNLTINDRDREKYIKDFNLIYNNKNIKNQDFKILKKNNKNILIIAYIFPPIGGSGVQRTLKFVKYLKKLGYEPTVITVGSDYINEKKDYSLLKEIPNDIKIIRVDHTLFNSEQLNREDIEQIINLLYGVCNNESIINDFINLLSQDRAKILTPDFMITWVNEVLKNIEQLIDINDYRCVYTTSAPYSVHIVGFYLKNKYNLKWIADFRDEWNNNPYKHIENVVISKLEFELENSIVHAADTVLQVTPLSTEHYKSIFELKESKVKTITNGYDENDFNNISNNKNSKKFSIKFSGVLYENMLPNNFIYAFNELIEENKVSKDLIEIVFYGKLSDEIESKISILDKYKLIKCKGYLDHKECIRENSKSNLLYLPIGEGERFKAIYSGKVFEYIRLQIPILALAPIDGVVAELLKRTRTGIAVECSDLKEIKDFVFKQYNMWRRNEVEKSCDFDEIKKYEREYLTEKLINIIESQ